MILFVFFHSKVNIYVRHCIAPVGSFFYLAFENVDYVDFSLSGFERERGIPKLELAAIGYLYFFIRGPIIITCCKLFGFVSY